MVNVLSSEWNDAEPCQLRTSVTMGKRLTRPLACGLALSVVLSSAAAQDAWLNKAMSVRPRRCCRPRRRPVCLPEHGTVSRGRSPGSASRTMAPCRAGTKPTSMPARRSSSTSDGRCREPVIRYVSPSACVIAREAKRGRLGRKPYFSLSWLGRNLEPERCALIIGPQVQREPPFTDIELTPPDQQFPVSRFIVVDRRNSL